MISLNQTYYIYGMRQSDFWEMPENGCTNSVYRLKISVIKYRLYFGKIIWEDER